MLAPAGTHATLLVVDTIPAAPAVRARIAIERFELAGVGELPVVPVASVVDGIRSGDAVQAQTAGIVERRSDRIVVRVPVPFPLSSDAPNATFTARPFVTTAPIEPPRRRRHDEPPTAAPSPSPEDTTPAELRKPLVSPSPTTTPS